MIFATQLSLNVIMDIELVKGYDGVQGNELADKNAHRAALRERDKLRQVALIGGAH